LLQTIGNQMAQTLFYAQVLSNLRVKLFQGAAQSMGVTMCHPVGLLPAENLCSLSPVSFSLIHLHVQDFFV